MDPLRFCEKCDTLFTKKHKYCPWHGRELKELRSRMIDNYELQVLSESGGFSVVYSAQNHDAPGLKKVVKVLKPPHCYQEHLVEIFRKEAEKLQKIEGCPQIPVVEQFSIKPFPWLRMPFISGKTLHQEIDELKAKGQAMAIKDAWGILRGIAEALSVAHSRTDDAGRSDPIIHRDIKPLNVMITSDTMLPPEARVRVIDWGLSLKASSDSGTQLMSWLKGGGTPDYMAPEQYRLETPSPANDVYSFGVLAFELLSGGAYPYDKPPESLRADTKSWAQAWQECHEKEPPKAFRRSVDGQLKRVVAACLEKDPEKRPKDGAALVKALKPFSWAKPLVVAWALVAIAAVVIAFYVNRPEVQFPPTDQKWNWNGTPTLGYHSAPPSFYAKSLVFPKNKRPQATLDCGAPVEVTELLWDGKRLPKDCFPKESSGNAVMLDFGAIALALGNAVPQGDKVAQKFMLTLKGRRKLTPCDTAMVPFSDYDFSLWLDETPPTIQDVTLGPFPEGVVSQILKDGSCKWWWDGNGTIDLSFKFEDNLGAELCEASVETEGGKRLNASLEKGVCKILDLANAFRVAGLTWPPPSPSGAPLRLTLCAWDKAGNSADFSFHLILDSGPGVKVVGTQGQRVRKVARQKARIELTCTEESLLQSLKKDHFRLTVKVGERVSKRVEDKDLQVECGKPGKPDGSVYLTFPLARYFESGEVACVSLQFVERGYLNLPGQAYEMCLFQDEEVAWDDLVPAKDKVLLKLLVEGGEVDATTEFPFRYLHYPSWTDTQKHCVETPRQPLKLRVSAAAQTGQGSEFLWNPGACSLQSVPEGKPFVLANVSDPTLGASVLEWDVSTLFPKPQPECPAPEQNQKLELQLETLWGKTLTLTVAICWSQDLPRDFEKTYLMVEDDQSDVFYIDNGKDVFMVLPTRPVHDVKKMQNFQVIAETGMKKRDPPTSLGLEPSVPGESGEIEKIQLRLPELSEGVYTLSGDLWDRFLNTKRFTKKVFMLGEKPKPSPSSTSECTQDGDKVVCRLNASVGVPGAPQCTWRLDIEDPTGIAKVAMTVDGTEQFDIDPAIDDLSSWRPLRGVVYGTELEEKYRLVTEPIGQRKEIHDTHDTLSLELGLLRPFDPPKQIHLVVADQKDDPKRETTQDYEVQCIGEYPKTFPYLGVDWVRVDKRLGDTEIFYISTVEVSNQFYWENLTEEEKTAARVPKPSDEEPQLPKTGLKPEAMLEFAKKHGFCLPTFDQWKFVARGFNNCTWVEGDPKKEPLRSLVALILKGRNHHKVNEEPSGLSDLRPRYPDLFGRVKNIVGNVSEVVLTDSQYLADDPSCPQFSSVGGSSQTPLWATCWPDKPKYKCDGAGFRLIAVIKAPKDSPCGVSTKFKADLEASVRELRESPGQETGADPAGDGGTDGSLAPGLAPDGRSDAAPPAPPAK